MGEVLLYVVLLGIVFIIGKIATGNIEREVERDKYITFDKEKETATLYKRAPISGESIEIRAHHNSTYKYNPEKIVYTGATVGGVTTGGFHTEEAHYALSTAGKSGKYFLQAKLSAGNYMSIDRIHLTDELVEEAKQNPNVKKFLRGKTLVLAHRGKATEMSADEQDVYVRALQRKDEAGMYAAAQRAINAKMLTREECENVLKWIRAM